MTCGAFEPLTATCSPLPYLVAEDVLPLDHILYQISNFFIVRTVDVTPSISLLLLPCAVYPPIRYLTGSKPREFR